MTIISSISVIKIYFIFFLCRGLEPVRLTDFATAVEYMEFTEAVGRSAHSGQAIALPLLDI